MGISWGEVEEAAEDRRSWRDRVAQCVFDAGWTRNQVFLPPQKTLYFIIYLGSEMGDIHCLPQKVCYYTTGKCLKCEVRCFQIKIHCCPCQAVDFYEMNFVAVLKVESSFNYQTYWEWLHSRSCYLWHHLENWIKTCNSCGFGWQCMWPAVNMYMLSTGGCLLVVINFTKHSSKLLSSWMFHFLCMLSCHTVSVCDLCRIVDVLFLKKLPLLWGTMYFSHLFWLFSFISWFIFICMLMNCTAILCQVTSTVCRLAITVFHGKHNKYR